MSLPRAFLICLALAACSKEPKEKKTEAASATPIAITVDGERVGQVDPGKAGTYAPLETFLPGAKKDVAGWTAIEVATRDGAVTIDAPAEKHPGQVAAFFPGKGGVAVGFFDPAVLAKKGAPSWRADGVTSVNVTTGPAMGTGGGGGGDGEGGGAEDDGERPTPSADLKITVVHDGKESVFTGDQLAALPTSTAPVGDTDTPGWTLPQILDAVGAKPTGKVVVHGGENANLILAASDFGADTTMFIKLNRSGQLRFRIFKKVGGTYEITGELRGIVKIEVE